MTNVLGQFDYSYDPANGLSRLAAVTYPNGQKTEYDWHPAAQHHRLAAITHRKGDNTLISSYGYAFSKGGQLRTWTQKVGADPLEHWQIEHDEAEQLRSVIAREGGPTGTILRQQFYNYDPAGNRTGYQDGHSVRALSYNHLNQITSQPAGGPVRFEGTIDEPGTVSINEQSATMRTVLDENDDPTFRFAADVPLSTGLNQVTVEAVDGSSNTTSELYEVSVTEQTGQTAPDYDTRGNMTSNGRSQSYEWDALNRLLAIEYADDTRTEFTYDALSRRVRILEKGDQGDPVTDKRLLWEGTDIVQERDAQNEVVKRYEDDGLALAEGSTYFYTRDHLGSIRQVTDQDEAVVEHYRYAPYGVSTASAPGGPNNYRLANFRYTGHFHHEKSSLHLAVYRAYDAELGEWLSEDPIEWVTGAMAEILPDGPNIYGYVGNNPINLSDPSGLQTPSRPGGFGGGGGGGGRVNPRWIVPPSMPYQPGSCPLSPNWGFNRTIKELYKTGFKYKGPTKVRGGYLFEHPVTGDQLRIMPRPKAEMPRSGNPEKWKSNSYCRFRSKNGQWQPPKSIPNADVPILSGGGCFIAGTKVWTPKGMIPIEKLKVGDEIFCYDVKSNSVTRSNIKGLITASRNDICEIDAGSGVKVQCSSNHRFYQGEGIWMAALKLPSVAKVWCGEKEGEDISNREAKVALSMKINKMFVYNIEVDVHHNYFVSDLKILVHNNKMFHP
jgi:RHS repeat-associated protein